MQIATTKQQGERLRYMLFRALILHCAIATLAVSASAQDASKSFKLKLGEQSYEIDAGETLDITLPDGNKSKISLERNEFANFAADRFSFMHPGNLSVSRSDLGDGVAQYLMATAIGSMVIVQTYANIDPSDLTDLMLKELTEDEVASGAVVNQVPSTGRVDGKVLKGLKATETLKDETSTYEILAHANDGSGVLIITRLDRDGEAEDGAKIAKFWDTLKLKQSASIKVPRQERRRDSSQRLPANFQRSQAANPEGLAPSSPSF